MGDTIKTILGVVGILLAVAVLFVIGVAIFGDPPTKEELEKEKWANAAVACWKTYERKSLTSDSKAGVAKMCEDMEAKAK